MEQVEELEAVEDSEEEVVVVETKTFLLGLVQLWSFVFLNVVCITTTLVYGSMELVDFLGLVA